jgi:hypothetical protein
LALPPVFSLALLSMNPSPAFQRFVDSTAIDYEKWHDGEGYDLAALREMTPGERKQVEQMMTDRTIEWREIEVLEALDSASGWKAVRKTYQDGRGSDTRLAAAAALHRGGKLGQPIDEVVAEAILKLRTIPEGSTRALLMAEEFPSDAVKRALLRASGRKNEIAMHCAALLCYLCGKAKEAFDWDLRPLFLRLAPDNAEADRKAAYGELCALVGMKP